MSKDRLMIDQDRNDMWIVVWYLAEDQCVGAWLGDGHPHKEHSKDEHDIASRAAFATGTCGTSAGGYVWEMRADATKALRAANAALRVAQSKVPIPDWAQKALAAGWKMPKGWRP